jgi:primosomal protein N'
VQAWQHNCLLQSQHKDKYQHKTVQIHKNIHKTKTNAREKQYKCGTETLNPEKEKKVDKLIEKCHRLAQNLFKEVTGFLISNNNNNSYFDSRMPSYTFMWTSIICFIF